MDEHRDQLARMQREAIWKWRWLGFRNSTPGFKGSLLVLAVAAAVIAWRAITL